MKVTGIFATIGVACLIGAANSILAQNVREGSAPVSDSVVQRIYEEGMHHSRAAAAAQVLTDSIGPRLTGSPANRAANDWLIRTYTTLGIPAHNEQYGTWREWRRGPSRAELVSPRLRTLEATMLAWSSGTTPEGVTGDVVALPDAGAAGDSAALARWLATVKGKFVLRSFPQPTCRPDTSWAVWASPASYRTMRAARAAAQADWQRRIALAGAGRIQARLEGAGVAGVLTSLWSHGWGVDKVMTVGPTTVPAFDVSCEDYALLARLAEHGQHPRIHVVADAQTSPREVPVYNTIAELKGTQRPDEYVVLSAHLDSWDAASGATDNGTGTVIMLEAMRLLRLAYPHPKRTIVAGHWSGEEEGEIGSSAYATDHPQVLAGLQASFTQDNGTGEIDTVMTEGFVDAPAAVARWMSRLPSDLTDGITIELPGLAQNEDSDSDAFACRNAPGFFLNSSDWHYTDYTWHTNRDTYDKISFDAVKRSATLIALLAYEAAEDPARVSRTRRIPPVDAMTGQPIAPPACSPAPRSWAEAQR